MKSRLFLRWQALLINLVLFASQTMADTPVVLISSPQGACATGVILSGGIVTNAHVTDSLCRFHDCADLVVTQASTPGELARTVIPCSRWEVVNKKTALDLSLLKCQDPDVKLPESNWPKAPIERPVEVRTVSYPGCGALEESNGEVNGESGLHLALSAKGGFGSSGGAVFNREGVLIGIIEQAASVSSLLQSMILFQSKFPLRAVKISHAQGLFQDESSTKKFDHQASVLLQYYREAIRTRSGFDRLFASFDFLSRVEGFKRDVTREAPSLASGLLPTSDYFISFPAIITSRFSSLVAATIIEGKGLSYQPWDPLSPAEQARLIALLPEVEGRDLKELFDGARQIPYQGMERSLLTFSFIAAIGVLLGGVIVTMVTVFAVRAINFRLRSKQRV